MRILHIDETFHPAFGYQCNPLAKFQQKAGNEVYIIAPTAQYIYTVYHSFGDYGEHLTEQDVTYTAETGVKIVRVDAKGWIMGRLNYRMEKLYHVINEIKPDAILVHCLETLTAIRLLRRLYKYYPLVLDSHMLAMASRNRNRAVFEFFYRIFRIYLITDLVNRFHYYHIL